LVFGIDGGEDSSISVGPNEWLLGHTDRSVACRCQCVVETVPANKLHQKTAVATIRALARQIFALNFLVNAVKHVKEVFNPNF
jgi:hypothetical protein